jgi:hypothetical protein
VSELLGHLVDPVLGELVWDGCCWTGIAVIAGRRVRLVLEPDRREPTSSDQIAIVEASRDRVRTIELHEPALRDAAARELARHVTGSAARIASGLELEAISLHGSGGLHYRDRTPGGFTGLTITVYFDADMAFAGVETYEAKPAR